MVYVALGRHSPESCPGSNARVRERVEAAMGKLEELGKKHKVRLLSGYALTPTHLNILTLEAPSVEAVRGFLNEAGLSQWNNIEIYPAQTLQEAMQEETPPPIW